MRLDLEIPLPHGRSLALHYPSPQALAGEPRRASDDLVQGAVLFFLFYVLIALGSWTNRHLPFYWDAIGYVYPHAHEIQLAHFFPILREWDVGHPTGYFFLLAVFLEIFGSRPFAGHMLNWGFSALMLTAVFGICRTLGLARSLAWGAVAAVMAFPLMASSSQQIMGDLALASLMLAALCLWSRRRYVAYFLLGSMALLTKLQGFVMLVAPLAALAVTSGRFWHAGRRKRFAIEVAWSLSPALSLAAFLVARYAVRGPGATIGWTPLQDLNPIWRLGAFLKNMPSAMHSLYVVPQLHHAMLLAAVAFVAALTMSILRRAQSGTSDGKWFPSPEASRMIAVLIFFALAYNLALLQLSALLARYSLPTVVVVLILLTWGLWHALRRRLPVLILLGVLSTVYCLQWYPDRLHRLPAPIARRLHPGPVVKPWDSENDMRFLDVIELIRWAGYRLLADMEARELPLTTKVATEWPTNHALAMPAMGYIHAPVFAYAMESWESVDPAKMRYILMIEGINNLPATPPEGAPACRALASERRGEATATIWYVEPPSATPQAPAVRHEGQ